MKITHLQEDEANKNIEGKLFRHDAMSMIVEKIVAMYNYAYNCFGCTRK